MAVCTCVCQTETHSWLLIVLILPWIGDTWGGTAALTGAAFQRRWTQKKGLSHSPFNWLHPWIIAKFFLGFSLVRTSRGTTSAIQRRAVRGTERVSERESQGARAREKYSEVWISEGNTRERERGRQRTHTHWGVCHSNLVPQGSTTQHYLKTGWQQWQKHRRRAVFSGFGSARGEDEGISLNRPACAVNLRHRAEGERDIWHRPGGRGTQLTTQVRELLPCSCDSKKKRVRLLFCSPFFVLGNI